MEFMRTLAAMHCQKKIKDGVEVVEISLLKVADVTTFIHACFCFHFGDIKADTKAIAKTIHENADENERGFCKEIERIRMQRTINVIMPTGATAFEIFDENDRAKKCRIFGL
jgi:hypothetical protein